MNAYDQPAKLILMALAIAFFAVLLASCDTPAEPDFTTSESVEAERVPVYFFTAGGDVILPKKKVTSAVDVDKLCKRSRKAANRVCPQDPTDPDYDSDIFIQCGIDLDTGTCECKCKHVDF